MLSQIRSALATLSPAERRAAEAILANPQAAIAWSLADVAQLANVSEPTIIRFCRSVGFQGYSEFRLHLAQAVALHRQPEVKLHSEGDDPVQALVNDTLDRTIAALREMAGDIDGEALGAAVSILRAARRIDIYGHGGSGFLAQEAQQRFVQLGLSAAAYSDPALQMFSAMTLTGDDCVVTISYTGVTPYQMPNLEIARNAGAKIISLAPSGTVLAKLADVNIALNAYRLKQETGFLPSERVTLYVMLDILSALLGRELAASHVTSG